MFEAMGSLTIEAELRFHAGARLIELGRRAEGEAELQRAIKFFDFVGAKHYARRAADLLAKSA